MTEAEYRAKLKSYHICVNCKTTDAYTLSGRRCCAECARKNAERKQIRMGNETYREKAVKASAEWRARMKEEKRCSRCGKSLSDGWGRKMCVECLAYCRNYRAAYRRKQGARTWEMRNEDGSCYICGKPSIQGTKMCQDCYRQRIPIAMENLKKAWDLQKNDNQAKEVIA